MGLNSGRTALLAAVLLVFALLCGIVVGVACDRMMLVHQHRLIPRHGGHFMTERIVTVLTRELKLDAAQEAKVRTILTQRQQNIERVMNQTQPAIDSVTKIADREIDAVLRPDQRPRFHELRDRWRAHHHGD